MLLLCAECLKRGCLMVQYYYQTCQMRIVWGIVVSLLLSQVATQSYQGVFALSWLAGYCLNEELQHKQLCDPAKIALWDHQSFTIHGLWPTITAPAIYGPFNLHLFEKNLKLFDDMSNYWPPKTKPSTTSVFLWDHEWVTHGKDYSAIIYALRPDDYTGTSDEINAALQLAYFRDTISFYKQFHGIKTPAGNYTKAEFASMLGLAENQFIFVCAKANIVREVQICFQTLKTGNVLATCTKTTNTCTKGGETVQLLDWQMRGQSRVFNYPESSQLVQL